MVDSITTWNLGPVTVEIAQIITAPAMWLTVGLSENQHGFMNILASPVSC